MGLFDRVTVSDELPLNDEMKELGFQPKDWDLQTKYFDSAMDHYVVKDKKLYRQLYAKMTRVVGDPKAESIRDRFDYFKREEPYLQIVESRDDFSFNAYSWMEDPRAGEWDCWTEWTFDVAKDGSVKSVSLWKFDKRTNAERKAQIEQFMKELNAYSRWYNRYIFQTQTYILMSYRIRYFLYKLGIWASALGRFF